MKNALNIKLNTILSKIKKKKALKLSQQRHIIKKLQFEQTSQLK